VVRVNVYFYSVTKTEKKNLEQPYAIKFCFKLEEGATDTSENIRNTFGNDSVSRAQLLRWQNGFVNGRGTV
jgi:hypothetical protein